MDISSTDAVNAAAQEAKKITDHLDLIINNATTASADTMKHDKEGPVFITYTGEPYPW